MNFLHAELDHERITARGLHKVMRTSWSIADMAGHARPCLEDTQIAYSLREGTGS
jgi:magnesium chelatase family protein